MSPFLDILLPRYLKTSTSLRVWSFSVMFLDGQFTNMTSVFWTLTLSPKDFAATANALTRDCSSSGVLAKSAASSANMSSLIWVVLTLEVDFSPLLLNMFESLRYVKFIPPTSDSLALFIMAWMYSRKRAGAKTHPCFTPVRTSNDTELSPSMRTDDVVFWCRSFRIESILGGHFMCSRILNNASL
uniref:Uncharacterized protein n=1 Tax=Cacopsylla melanoneura TaxID=428564 RepID=A0A8D8LRV0_9HEMI